MVEMLGIVFAVFLYPKWVKVFLEASLPLAGGGLILKSAPESIPG